MNKAILTVRDLAKMHPSTRKRFIRWLRMLADDLEAAPKEYADRFQAKFK